MPERCRYLLLLVGELVTNALKHAAHGRKALIAVDLKCAADRCCLVVRSNTPDAVDRRPRTAEELLRAAGGDLDVTIDGCEFRVTAFLPAF